jgi:hypothetical protein
VTSYDISRAEPLGFIAVGLLELREYRLRVCEKLLLILDRTSKRRMEKITSFTTITVLC